MSGWIKGLALACLAGVVLVFVVMPLAILGDGKLRAWRKRVRRDRRSQ